MHLEWMLGPGPQELSGTRENLTGQELPSESEPFLRGDVVAES